MVMKKKHTLWIEKYRSENLDQYIGNETMGVELNEESVK
jgi:hypothetical protein